MKKCHFVAAAATLAAAMVCCWPLAAHSAEQQAPAKLSSRTAGLLAPVVDKLNALGVQFDADKNQSLSADERDELLRFVAKTHGQAWADRLKAFLAAADTNADGVIGACEWKRAVERLRPAKGGDANRQAVMLPMSDGVRLATDVYLPSGAGPFPVVFSRTPYSRTKAAGMAAAHARAGLALVVQDMRGRFDSEGENLPFIGCGWGEHKDGVETLAWIRKQSWCNGKVCTVGGSAGGITQNLLAAAGPERLTAQHISVAAASIYHDATYVGGALRLCQVENWTTTNRFSRRALDIMREHPSYDDYWRQFDTTLRFAEMNAPAMHVGGWFDTFAQGTIDSFVGRQHQGASRARGKQKLVMGPWTHTIGRNLDDAELVFPNAQMPKDYESSRWLEHHLLGVDNGVMDLPAVTYYVLGDVRDAAAPGNEWRRAEDWPVPYRPTAYYLQSGGRLSLDKPAAPAEPVQYTFDPANPCPTLGGNNLTIARGPRNQNPIESRSDVVLFTSEPLEKPLEVTGRVRAKILIASSAVDTDLSIRLCDVYPDGKSYNMAEGMLRLRYRKSFEQPEPLAPGEVVEAEVDCWSTSIVFNRGHRIRVTLTSSNYPRFDMNPGTGKPWQDDQPSVKQTNRIFIDAAHPSAIVLPVVTMNDEV